MAPGFVAHELALSELSDPEGLVRAATGPVAPYATVEVEVARGAAAVSAGLATGDDEHVLATWSAGTSRVTISIRRAGRTRVVRRRKVALAAPFRFAFVLCENQVTALADTGAGWRPLLTERAKVKALVDLRREDVLAAHVYAWGGDSLGGVRAGLFGMTGLRDPHLVQHADGTPYVRDGRMFLTWTAAGTGSFQQAHWTVWSFDPADTPGMRLEAQLFSRRGGLVVGDHAGQLVRDGDRWLVATSSWGDFEPGTIHVRHTTSSADLLAGVHVLDTVPTSMPTGHGTWDPALTRVGDRWHLAYVESRSQRPFTFHPALAATTSADWTDGLTAVARMTVLGQCEGPILATVDDAIWLLASDGRDRCFPVFDLTGHRVGRLDAPYGTNIPHPQLVPDPAGGWLLVTFDGTPFDRAMLGYGGHGDVVVLHSS
ncbi:MAG: hypothetical protein JWN22_2573 [Nocardioides sp.]|nr:hypothetical protein [Nocardioides sp.]